MDRGGGSCGIVPMFEYKPPGTGIGLIYSVNLLSPTLKSEVDELILKTQKGVAWNRVGLINWEKRKVVRDERIYSVLLWFMDAHEACRSSWCLVRQYLTYIYISKYLGTGIFKCYGYYTWKGRRVTELSSRSI